MKLHALERKSEKKSDAIVHRRSGKIPAVLYAKGAPNLLLCVSDEEFQTALRAIKQGRLSTTVFSLVLEGKERKAIVKDIQYHPTTYRIIHLDFQELTKGSRVTVKVPISCVGASESVGVKLGGFLRQVLRTVKVECPAESIPSEFILDVRELGARGTKRLSDLPRLGEQMKFLGSMNEVVAVIAKR